MMMVIMMIVAVMMMMMKKKNYFCRMFDQQSLIFNWYHCQVFTIANLRHDAGTFETVPRMISGFVSEVV